MVDGRQTRASIMIQTRRNGDALVRMVRHEPPPNQHTDDLARSPPLHKSSATRPAVGHPACVLRRGRLFTSSALMAAIASGLSERDLFGGRLDRDSGSSRRAAEARRPSRPIPVERNSLVAGHFIPPWTHRTF